MCCIKFNALYAITLVVFFYIVHLASEIGFPYHVVHDCKVKSTVGFFTISFLLL